MPAARIYIRCSHADSAESGLGMESQELQGRAYYDLLRLRFPELRDLRLDPTIYRDVVVSAYRKRTASFDRRHGGRKLLNVLQPGDHIIFARLDRSFRNALECRRWVDHWMASGIRVHFVDLQVDTSTANGMMMMGVMSYTAEWYSAKISEATKAGLRQKLLRDGFVKHPVGAVRVNGEYVVQHDRLVFARYVRLLRDILGPRMGENLSWRKICWHWECRMAEREGRKPTKLESRWPHGARSCYDSWALAAQKWPERYAHRPDPVTGKLAKVRNSR